MTQRLDGLSALRTRYDAVLCDVWGVLHNGVKVYDAAATALRNWREDGGRVVMITNSPRPREGVAAQFGDLGVPPGVCDAIVTSGDVTRRLIATAPGPIHHLGPARDTALFDGLNVAFASLADANAIVCTGLLDDENEEPEDYLERLSRPAEKGVPFICANPDIVVERGDRLVWCAGSLAQLYNELGGLTRLAGKPHPPMYRLAREELGDVADERILCIGDGLPTDVRGANAAGLDLLFVAEGIHMNEYAEAGTIDGARLDAFLKENDTAATGWIPRLVW